VAEVESWWLQPLVIDWTQILLNSYRQLLGVELLDRSGTPAAQSQRLSVVPWAIVSHGTAAEPILNYGNKAALELWEMDWPTFTATASKDTAEPIDRAARQQLLELVQSQGFVRNYQGVRISSTGRRFTISNVVIWNLQDHLGRPCGQAATFDHWQFL
jgi:MEKHLA domain